MAARPTDFILKVYMTEAEAIIGADTNALNIIGDQVTATNITVTVDVPSAGKDTITIGGTVVGDITDTFEAGDTVTVSGSTSNDGNHVIESRTDTTFVVGNTCTAEGSHVGTYTFTNATKTRAQINNNEQLTGAPFFTHERLFYRLESLTPASEFYIDWDDGDDNTPEKANFSIRKFDLPTNYAVFEHTYTKHGEFFPMVRLTSPEGFKSKLYTPAESPRASYRELEPAVDLSGSVGQTKSQVALDSMINARIPSFAPSNHPPIAILKTDRNQVMSGIDNSIVVESGISEAKRRAYCYIDGRDLGIRHASGINGGIYNLEQAIEVVYETVNGDVVKETVSATTASADDGRTDPAPFADAIFPTAAVNAGLAKILSVKLVKLKENPYGDQSSYNTSYYNVKTDGLYPDERIWIRLVDNDDATDSPNYPSFGSLADSVREIEAQTSYPCFCYVSNGNPYVSVDGAGYKVVADGSESRTRNSNVDIHRYYLYDDKLRRKNNAGSTAVTISQHDVAQFSDKFSTQVEANANAKQTLTYTHDYTRGQQLDDNQFDALSSTNTALSGVGRFFDDHRLLRLQVEDTSVDGGTLATQVHEIDAMDRSFVECDNVSYRTDGIRPTSLQHTSLLLFVNSSNSWQNLETGNIDNSKVCFGGDGSTKSSSANLKLTDVTGSVDSSMPTNFLLVVKDRKFNKVFFRQDNDIALRSMFTGGTAPHCKLTAYYNTPTGWKALPIQDETIADHKMTAVGRATSLYNSGPVSWDLPEDWTAGAHNDILSGTWNISSKGDGSTATEPQDLWTTTNFPTTHKDGGGYAILFGIKTLNTFSANITIENFHTTVCDNQHSKIIKIRDPKHISLNSGAGKKHITQSVSFSRKGNYYQIKDRLGTSEIRKLGAAGGNVTFGGVELGDGSSASSGTKARERLVQYQKQGTPVYFDVQHKNGTYTRFFGLVSSISEDMPTANMMPKYGINMIVSHIAEFDSDGSWTEDLISIGGEEARGKAYLD